MSQTIRYQVFVSSTFTDLKEERAEVIQALWELDCIPTGMEAFLASSEAQWEVIKKIIDECDYYILIIGGRYGSIAADGISYTEKEYNYAKDIGVPILGFIHGEPNNISVSKVESERDGRERLSSFRDRVMSERPIRKWVGAQELGGLVSRSVSRAIKIHPRPGWVRNMGPSNFELLEQLNVLSKENSSLKDKITQNDHIEHIGGEFAGGSDKIVIEGHAAIYGIDESGANSKPIDWKLSLSWDALFRDVGPLVMNEATDEAIKHAITRFISWSKDIDHDKYYIDKQYLSQESFAEVIVQFRALGFIKKGTRKRAVSDRASYWAITEKGERYLITLLARKKQEPPQPVVVGGL